MYIKDEWECLEKRPENSQLTHLFSTARQRFLAISEQFEKAENNTEVLPGIKLMPAPGHSPGNALLEITSAAQKLLCIGDIIHINIEFQRPDYLAWLDVAPDQALSVRNEIFDQAAKARRLIFACHFDYPGLGHIVKKGAGFAWRPVVVNHDENDKVMRFEKTTVNGTLAYLYKLNMFGKPCIWGHRIGSH
jgi:glyoxylase-like metal-dependent hydrolase (beta-lactamase superfamily II)